MKKFLLICMVLLTGGAMSAWAGSAMFAGTSLIDGVPKTLTSSNHNFIKSGSIEWDGNNKITLKNVQIEQPNTNYEGNTIFICHTGMYIMVEGKCSIKMYDMPSAILQENGSVFVKGNSLQDVLEINYVGTDVTWENSPVIHIQDDRFFYITNVNLKVTSKETPIIYSETDGLVAVQNAKVYFDAQSDKAAVSGVKQFDLTGVYYVYNGQKFDSSTKTIVDANGSAAQTVLIDGNIIVGDKIFNTSYYADVPITSDFIKSGSIYYTASTKTLTLDGASMTTEGTFNCIQNNNVEDLTIYVKEGSNITTNGVAYGIYAKKSTTIKTNPEASSNLFVINAKSIGIYQELGTLAFDEATVICTGTRWGITGTPDETPLIISNSTIATICDESGNASFNDFKSCEMQGCCVANTMSPDYCWRQDYNAFCKPDGSMKDAVWIGAYTSDTKSYGIEVLGTQMNSYNYKGFAADGLTAGEISYDESTKTLTLKDVNIEAPEDDLATGVFISDDAETVWIEGANYIHTNGECIGLSTDVTFNGAEGCELTAVSKKGAAMSIYNSGVTTTIEVPGVLVFHGTGDADESYGYWGTSNDNLIVKEAGNSNVNSDYMFKGTHGAVVSVGSLTMSGVDFYSWAADGTPGCYFDSESHAVMQNGGIVVEGENQVDFYKPVNFYDVWVLGERLTSCNSGGLGSPLINHPEAVTFMSSDNTLYLTDAKVGSLTFDKTGTIETSLDGLTIVLDGVNTILNQAANYWPVKLSDNTTITSADATNPGTLIVEDDSEDPSIFVSTNVNLTVKDAIIKTDGMRGNSDPTLTVDNSDITLDKNLEFFGALNILNGGGIVLPEGGYFDTGKRCVVDSDGNKAEGVHIVPHDEFVGIDGIETADVETGTVYDLSGRRQQTLQRGVNIIKARDGKVGKIVKK